MVCKHEQIMCRNCVKICLKCGAELPSGFIPGKDTQEAPNAAETPIKAEKTATKKTTRKKVTK